MPPGAPTVLIGNKAAARIGDRCLCGGAPDKLIRGAMPVRVAKSPAARKSDITAHGGQVTTGEEKTLIGLKGISGNFFAGIGRCKALAAGRQPPAGALDPNNNQIQSGTGTQSYNNCGVESTRQLIQQATGSTISQEQLLNQAVAGNLADSGVPRPPLLQHPPGQQMYYSGGTLPAGRAQILTNNGVAATTVPPTMPNLETAVSQGQGVTSDVWAGSMPTWQAVPNNNLVPGTGAHTVVVTGVEYDANGNPVNVIINDTGLGQCGQKIPYAAFQSALIGGGNNHVVTTNPIW